MNTEKNKIVIGQHFWHESAYGDDYTVGQKIHNQLVSPVEKTVSTLDDGSQYYEINTTKNTMKVWSWGARGWVNLGDALKFKVDGRKFKGEVIIWYRSDDTYTILYGKVKRSLGWVVKHFDEGIYGDMLVDVIDYYVESDE